ncbi:MAG: bifunctional 4-hydroxy-3-methylbut-2-enyl diphosphate reductase/30S ribosomal protein S1 [Firmicutes bacterium]|nr:bifunctional 4-hydroxy-3-methylbut-2-enyl diphosphate reductase/30S ribosomal protein S1 [Bacillota bacterium]
MRVEVADDIGFCYGVRRAVEMAEEAAASGERTYCLGQLIHNPQEVERLRAKGVIPVEDLTGAAPGVLVLRAHGTLKGAVEEAARSGMRVLDATCPHVKAAQEAAARLYSEGYRVVIVGDPDHPEVRATNSYAGGECVVIEGPEGARSLGPVARVGIVAQTTVRRDLFESVAEIIASVAGETKVVRTICDATMRRQEAVRRLAERCDLVLVVGGRNSANTRRLAEIAREGRRDAYLIETAAELEPDWFRGKGSVGIAGGTSTPDWIIKEVVGKVEDMDKAVIREDSPEGAGGNASGRAEGDAPGSAEGRAEEPTAVPSGGAENAPGREEGASPGVPGDAAESEDAAASEGEEAAGSISVPEEHAPAAPSEPQDGRIYDESLKTLKEGDVIPGRVVSLDENGVMVDVGYKSEGIIPPNELSRKQVAPAEVVRPGDEIMVYVLGVDNQEGVLRLSKRRADEELAWQRLEESLKEGRIIEAPVVQEVKGGLVVDVGVRGFVPASQIERGYVSNLSKYSGRTLRVKVLELDRSKNRVVLSQRVVLEEERERLRAQTWADIAEGQIRQGVVKGITDFGAFVDIGGVDGLLHVSELSWGRVSHPTEVVKEGDEIDVMILRIDREKGKISLGLKQVLPDPWATVATKYPVDSVVEGKVTRLAPFGAFVQLEPGVEGLIHISEMSRERVSKPDEVVSPGQSVRVKVLRSRPEDRRISLSLRAVEDDREKKRVDDYLSEQRSPDKVTLGEVFGDILDEAKNESQS